jgi:hypothetical protein
MVPPVLIAAVSTAVIVVIPAIVAIPVVTVQMPMSVLPPLQKNTL